MDHAGDETERLRSRISELEQQMARQVEQHLSDHQRQATDHQRQAAEYEQRLTSEKEQGAKHEQRVADLEAQIKALEHRIAQLLQRTFGKKSEKLPIGKLMASPAPPPGGDGPARQRGSRKPLPEHLPRYRTDYEIDAADRCCADCGDTMTEFGEITAEELEHIRMTLVHQMARKKYSCKKCQGTVVVADGPVRVLDKCMAGPSFLAHVLVQKFADHLPLYRQERMLKRDGIAISRATLCSWVSRCGQMLDPIAKAILRTILAAPCVQTDDTGLLIQVVDDGKAQKGFVWTYTTPECLVYYQLTTGRGSDGPLAILGNYVGYVQADGLPSYDALFRVGKAVEVACWAHSRRKFIEAIESDGVRAQLMVEKVRDLYQIEREAKVLALDPAAVLALRQDRAKPILRDIEAVLQDWNPKNNPPKVLPKSPLGVAVTYAINQWQALCRYAEDGRLDIDNNRSERMLRHVAIGRKNWLSVGNEMTGQEAANVMTVVMTCRALDIDPQIYLTRTLQDLARSDGTEAQIEEWTPMRWKDRGLDVTVIEEHREHIGKVLAAAVANAARTSLPPK